MQATVLYGAGDVRFEDRPDPAIVEPTDAVIRLPVTCICGSRTAATDIRRPANVSNLLLARRRRTCASRARTARSSRLATSPTRT